MAVKLSPHPFLDHLSPASRRRLGACARAVKLPDGADIFLEADAPDFLYLLRRGRVELLKTSRSGQDTVLLALEAGDYFGETGVLDGGARMVSARASGAVELEALPSAEVRAVLEAEPLDATLKIFAKVFGYLRAANERFLAELVRKEKLQLVGEMAGSIIHDFKNPLASIQLAAEWIRKGRAEPRTLKACQAIVRQSERMVGMAHELLDFSRGRLELKAERRLAADILEAFRQLNEVYLQQSRVELEIRASEAWVKVDEDRFQRVLQNLLSNAVEAIGPRGGRVSVSAGREGKRVVIALSDDGPGIPPEVQGSIFEPFVTHGKRRGSGLGMTIVKKIVEAHGGEISFETAPKRGTTFRISLPAA